MITHLYGQLCKLDEIITICKEESIYLPGGSSMSGDDLYRGYEIIRKVLK